MYNFLPSFIVRLDLKLHFRHNCLHFVGFLHFLPSTFSLDVFSPRSTVLIFVWVRVCVCLCVLSAVDKISSGEVKPPENYQLLPLPIFTLNIYHSKETIRCQVRLLSVCI